MIIPVWHAHVNGDGRLEIEERERNHHRAYLGGLAGKNIEIILRPARQQRSSRANRYYFGVIVPLIAEHCGYENDEMHELLAMRFLRIEDDPVTGSPRRKRTPATNSHEFAEFTEACIRFAASLGVVIPAPSDVEA